MKSRKQNPVLSKMKRPQLVLKLLAMALMLQCILGLHTDHLPHEDNEYDVISSFHGLSGIQCSLKCTTLSEKCDAIASEAEGGKTGSCKLLKLASAIVIPLAPPNRLEKGKTKGKMTVLKPKMTPIPVDGGWSAWTAATSCSATCGDGSFNETRLCNNPAQAYAGISCQGDAVRLSTCNTQGCPIDGGWSAWTAATSCSATCDGGSFTETRLCNNPAQAYAGISCQGDAVRLSTCNTQGCPIDGAWGEWSTWTDSSCSTPCKQLTEERTRACDSPAPLNSGAFCVGGNIESVPCGTLDCVRGDEADQFCQSQSMSLATIPGTIADIQALADTLPVPDVYYWFQYTDLTPPSGRTFFIKSITGSSSSNGYSPNSNLYPAACE